MFRGPLAYRADAFCTGSWHSKAVRPSALVSRTKCEKELPANTIKLPPRATNR